MSTKISRLTGLLGVAFGALIFASGAQAHECRALGQAQNEDMGQYWLCAGFAVEDGDRPRAGTRNNVDIIPIWVPGNPHAAHGAAARHQLPDEPVDTRRGDTFDVRVKLVHIKGDFYDIPHDEETHRLLDDWFFLKQHGTGYSSPLANTRFVLPLFWLRPVDVIDDGETTVMYRTPYDFVTPFPGIYAWVVEGTMRRQGQAPIRFMEKFVSAQPRIPYGPEVVHAHDIDLTTLMGAPEGWFDSVRPANGGGHPHAVRASSPRAAEILRRAYGRK